MSVSSVAVRAPYLKDIDYWRYRLIAGIVTNTDCNRRCPLCCFKDITQKLPPHQYEPEDVSREVYFLGNVGKLYLLGGEVTIHRKFEELLRLARAARGPRFLAISTNGDQLLEVIQHTHYLNEILVSYSTEASRARITPHLPAGVCLVAGGQPHYDLGGGPKHCNSIHNTISVRAGRVYPCCVGAGITDAPSTELTEGWEERVLRLEAPCERCVNGTF